MNTNQNNEYIKEKKYKKIICLIILVLVCLCLFIIYLYKQREYILEQQDYISKVSNNHYPIKYLGDLKYNRKNFNSIQIDKNRILVIGQGYDEKVSKTAEIFDIKKKKTTKIITLCSEHSDDFLLKLSNGNILVIGKTLENIDLKSRKTFPIELPKKYKFGKGYASEINKDKILIIYGNSAPNDFITKNYNVYIYNLKTNKIEEKNLLNNSDSIFSYYYHFNKPIINFNNNIYLVSCDYYTKKLKEETYTTYSFYTENCSLKKLNEQNKTFDIIADLPSKAFPYHILPINETELLIFSSQYILKYNITNNNYTDIVPIDSNINLLGNYQYINKISENLVLALGDFYSK